MNGQLPSFIKSVSDCMVFFGFFCLFFLLSFLIFDNPVLGFWWCLGFRPRVDPHLHILSPTYIWFLRSSSGAALQLRILVHASVGLKPRINYVAQCTLSPSEPLQLGSHSYHGILWWSTRLNFTGRFFIIISWRGRHTVPTTFHLIFDQIDDTRTKLHFEGQLFSITNEAKVDEDYLHFF